MQKIDNIEIKNFKSIRHQKIEGCKRINVFIGYPNVGKSNILEALSIFAVLGNEFDLSNLIRFEKLTTFFYNGEISKKAEVVINNYNRYFIELLGNFLRFTYEFDYAKLGFDLLDTNQDSSREKVSSFEINESSSKIFNFEERKKHEKNLPEIKRYEFANKIQFETGQYLSLKYPYGNNIFDIISTNEKLLSEMTELFKSYQLELFYDSRSQEFQILKRIGIKGFTVPYNLVADTLKRLIFYKAAILSNKDSVLLFEEPESHMFPPYIAKLTTDIIFDENNNQFFIATHSPFVLNDLMDNLKSDELAIYIVSYKKETGETIIDRMSDEDIHEAYQFGYDFFMNIDKFISQKQHDEV